MEIHYLLIYQQFDKMIILPIGFYYKVIDGKWNDWYY